MKKLILSFLGILACATLFARTNVSLQDSEIMRSFHQTLNAENNFPKDTRDMIESQTELLEKIYQNTLEKNSEDLRSTGGPAAEAVEAESGGYTGEEIETIKKNAGLLHSYFQNNAYIHRPGSNGYRYADDGFLVMAEGLFLRGIKDFKLVYFKDFYPPWKMNVTLKLDDKIHGRIELKIKYKIEYDEDSFGSPGSGKLYFISAKIVNL